MTLMSEEERVLTSDERGRVRVSAERRGALLDEFERSGMSGAKFARLAGIKYPTFALWMQKRKRQRQESGPVEGRAGDGSREVRPMGFLEAVIEREDQGVGSGHGLMVVLPGGVRMEVATPTQLRLAAELLRLVREGGGRAC